MHAANNRQVESKAALAKLLPRIPSYLGEHTIPATNARHTNFSECTVFVRAPLPLSFKFGTYLQTTIFLCIFIQGSKLLPVIKITISCKKNKDAPIWILEQFVCSLRVISVLFYWRIISLDKLYYQIFFWCQDLRSNQICDFVNSFWSPDSRVSAQYLNDSKFGLEKCKPHANASSRSLTKSKKGISEKACDDIYQNYRQKLLTDV